MPFGPAASGRLKPQSSWEVTEMRYWEVALMVWAAALILVAGYVVQELNAATDAVRVVLGG